MLLHRIAGTVNIVTTTPLALHALCFLLIQNSPYEIKSNKMDRLVSTVFTVLDNASIATGVRLVNIRITN